MFFLQNLLARQAASFGESEPCLNSTFAWPGPIMIDDPMQPQPADFAQRTVGDDSRILDRDIELIIKAVGDPTPNRLGTELALVHRDVKRMLMMVSSRSDFA